MNVTRIAAVGYAVVSAGVIAFQLALAAGAPWGSFAMGGASPGQFPPPLRIAALVQAVLLGLMAGVVLARADVALRSWSRASTWLVWVVVVFGAVSLVLNLLTPSARERALWAPVAFLMFACCLRVATSRVPGSSRLHD